MPARFADVILPLSLPKPFTYAIPLDLQGLLEVGHRVVVPFGRQKLYTGVVSELHDREHPDLRPKTIEQIADPEPLVRPLDLAFWRWMARYYVAAPGDVLNAALPAALKLTSETRFVHHPDPDADLDALTDDAFVVLEALESAGELTLADVQDVLGRRQVYPVLQELMARRLCVALETLREQYRPKMARFVRLADDRRDDEALRTLFADLESKPKQLRVIMTYLQLCPDRGWMLRSDLVAALDGKTSSVDTLIKHGVLTQEDRTIDRLPAGAPADTQDHVLSDEQQAALEALCNAPDEQAVHVLEGVTGSGKTHVYIERIRRALQDDPEGQVLYLLPEIALTTQLVDRLQRRFGADVGVYHSRFNDQERVEIREAVRTGGYRVVLTARSGLFLPFRRLALIIVDEEQERSFKQFDPAPRYNARDAAIVLATMHDCPVVLGSATLSLETRANIDRGKYGHVRLTRRYGDVELPEIELVDIARAAQRKEMNGVFAQHTLEAIRATLDRDRQVLLFQNRRGFSSFLHCGSCGWVPPCRNCDVSLTYHKFADRLICHYCGFQTRMPEACTACGETPLLLGGIGTEQIQEELQLLLPDHVVGRMDLDTTRSKRGHAEIIGDFERGKMHVLVGTQMVTKGLDFGRVGLVGILDADQLIHHPDFRSAERAFHLIAQVSGRAGRREEVGRVLVQTRRPDQDLLQWIRTYDFETFYEREMEERRTFGYPPFKRLILLTLRHGTSRTVDRAAREMARHLQAHLGERVLGPAVPSVSRIRNKYLREILLKIELDADVLRQAKQAVRHARDHVKNTKGLSGVLISVNVDP